MVRIDWTIGWPGARRLNNPPVDPPVKPGEADNEECDRHNWSVRFRACFGQVPSTLNVREVPKANIGKILTLHIDSKINAL